MVGGRGVVGRWRRLPLPIALHPRQHPRHARDTGPRAAHPAPALPAGVDDVDGVGVGGALVPLQALAGQGPAVQEEEEVVRPAKIDLLINR